MSKSTGFGIKGTSVQIHVLLLRGGITLAKLLYLPELVSSYLGEIKIPISKGMVGRHDISIWHLLVIQQVLKNGKSLSLALEE